VDVKGKRIYVCCETCVAAVKKDPDKYIAKLQQEGVKIADAPK
jgi:YHS domain-containing protein